MKVKLFIRDKSSFRSWRKHTQDFEDEINTWLAAHPGIRVVQIQQSSNGGSLDTTKIVISVWYELAEGDNAERLARASSPIRAQDERFTSTPRS
jgi:hypothetical protein